jgi:hypothetical protein
MKTKQKIGLAICILLILGICALPAILTGDIAKAFIMLEIVGGGILITVFLFWLCY